MAESLGIIKKPNRFLAELFLESPNVMVRGPRGGYPLDLIRQRFNSDILGRYMPEYIKLVLPSDPIKPAYVKGYAIPIDKNYRLAMIKGQEYLTYFPFVGIFRTNYETQGLEIYDAFAAYDYDKIRNKVDFRFIHIYSPRIKSEFMSMVCSCKPNEDITHENCILGPIAVANRLYQEYLALDRGIKPFKLDCHPHGDIQKGG